MIFTYKKISRMFLVRYYLAIFLLFTHYIFALSFIGLPNARIGTQMIPMKIVPVSCEINERVIYRQYLIGLRKTRRYLHNATNIHKMVSILNFTNNFVSNYTNTVMSVDSNIAFNNTEVGVKNIKMGNIILDVSNVEYIHISTSKDTITLELDKQKKSNNLSIIERLNNIETIISTLTFLGRFMNFT